MNVLVTGANGEIGHSLVQQLTESGRKVVALDVREADDVVARHADRCIRGDITDGDAILGLGETADFTEVYHLAALLSTASERNPLLAHRVNVGGTLHLLELAARSALSRGTPTRFFFPSSIAAHGLPDLATKTRAGRVPEGAYLTPITMYGANKLAAEQLGAYYARNWRLLDGPNPGVDFRSLRFPGLLSATTVPTGGTSDYGPELIHKAAQGTPYAAFVREDTRIPFMAMPDAIDAIVKLMAAPAERLSQRVYQVGACAPTASDFADVARAAFPGARLTTDVNPLRQSIVDSWPEDVDDTVARADWGYAPRLTFETMMREWLLPEVRRRYGR